MDEGNNRGVGTDAIPSAYVHRDGAVAAKGRLYSPDGVGIATFFGMPLAGGILLALNYRTLERPGAAWAVFFGAVCTTALLFAIVYAAPETARFALALPFGAYAVAKALQGKELEEHRNAGGSVASNWIAAGVGMVPAGLFVWLYFWSGASRLPDKKISFGNGQQIYYERSVNVSQVRALGAFLKNEGFFGEGVGDRDVLLSRDGRTYAVSFVYEKGHAKYPSIRSAFQTFAKKVSEDVFRDAPVVVRLVDERLRLIVRIGWGSAPVSAAEIVKEHRERCAANEADECLNLGAAYRTGSGVAKDEKQEAAAYDSACGLGQSKGCYNLALMYAEGSGRAKDLAYAAELYRGACDDGEALACNNLGVAYMNGAGVTQDVKRAGELYQKACDAGNTLACENLAGLR